MAKKKDIPAVDVESMNVDVEAYPRLGAEAQASEPPDPQTAGPATATQDPQAAPASAASAGEAGAPDDTRPSGGAGATAGVFGQAGALIAAGVAGAIAVVALAVAWSERGDVAALQTAVHEASEAAVVDQREGYRALAGGLALLHLGVRVREDAPFVEELAAARQLFADDPAALRHMEMLAPVAARGLTPVALLQENFRQVVVPSVRRASVASFFSSFAVMFERALPGGDNDTVAARHTPGAAGPHVGLDEIHRVVLAGELEHAVTAIRPYAETMPPARQWMAVAEQRLAAHHAVAALERIALEKLTRLR